jgi:tripartite-type tricarboxylate transporter receptor subunit TctC
MGEIAGQPFVVENRSGSGGNVGADAIAKAKPDGYTIGLGSIAPARHRADALQAPAVRRRA